MLKLTEQTMEKDDEWEAEMEEALKEAKDILANPQNYPSYKTVDELWAALEKDNEWEAEMEQALKESNDIIANPQNYPSYKTIAELRKALDEED